MSVEPDRPSSSDPALPKADTDPSGENSETLRQKRRFKKGVGAESEEGEKPDQTIQLLSTLLQDLIAKKESPTTPETESKTSKYHRLSKTGSGTTGTTSENAPAAGNTPPPGGAVVDSPAAAPVAGPAAPSAFPPVSFRPAPLYTTSSRGLWIWIGVLGFTVFVGAVYATITHFKPSADALGIRTKSAAPPPAVIWTDATLNQLEQALAADQAGDIKGALRLASAIKKPDTASPPGLDLYLASLSTRADHHYDVESDLMHAVYVASPEEAGALNERLAFNFSRARDFEKAADFYRAASRFDPFSAPLYYHWGEALRHQGHSQDAAACFRRALGRIPTGQPELESLRDCINLKLRLATLERGQENEFQTEMAEQVKAPLPSGYWLLTAAAVALQHKNLPEAITFLGRAREVLGVAQFDALLNDYFFRAYADRKELAEFFPLDPATRREKLQPTMTYTVEP